MQKQKTARPGDAPPSDINLGANAEAAEAAAGARAFLAKLDGAISDTDRIKARAREQERAQEQARKQSRGCGCGW